MTPLHHIGEAIRNLALTIPLPMVRVLFVGLPVILLIWVLRLPREETTPPDNTGGWASNLKVWATLSLLFQIIVYACL